MSKQQKEIHLSEYKRPKYWIRHTDLIFEIESDKTYVSSNLTIEKNEEYKEQTALVLDGVNLELLDIKINDEKLKPEYYSKDDQQLTIKTELAKFNLQIKVAINPDTNHSCEGFYKSGNIYCTQNEAEGFRKITYYQDRPDIMSSFKTSIIADKSKFPYILSNGNLESSLDLSSGKHKTVWNDPFPKPCYLFALVAGDLGRVQDEFTTMSGKKIKLEIYVDHGNEDKTRHAMDSLKNSMKWDEDNFGLEYDLDCYMIVAVDSFNMGAMENKGLNIFNSHYVLAKPETATDSDFKGIEGVIGHEYFHNWTGNRVTCRDWFQLTLKEGLTVFRDQEFSADMGSRSVKHIEDIKCLKLRQFPEDAGPLSHPIQPKSYVEINNFYTSTIYEKGAQIIRMIETLIGRENFRKGMDLYFSRFDGQAVTTNDFVKSMADASGQDLDHFMVWYDQNGTPSLDINTNYDEEKNEYKITVTQSTNTNHEKVDCLYMPFHFSLLSEDGEPFNIEQDGKMILDSKTKEMIIPGITSRPIPIWNLGFAAPIKVNYEYTVHDLLIMMTHSKDTYSQYNATEVLFRKEIDKLVNCQNEARELEVEPKLIDALEKILDNSTLDDEFKSYLLQVPSEKAIFDTKESYDFEMYKTARTFLIKSIGLSLFDKFLDLVHRLDQKGDFSIDQESIGQRALKKVCFHFLAATSSPSAFDLIYSHYQHATNMTEEISAFSCLINYDNPYQLKVRESFYNKWKNDTLVIQKWLSQLACARDTSAKDLLELEKLEVYDNKIPNLVRSLYSGFINSNIAALNDESGAAYQIIIDKIIEIDAFNPQLAARMAKGLDFINKLDEGRKSKFTKQMVRLKNTSNLSSDTLEIVTKNLA
jgi:aminopeptidase N